MRLPNGVHVDTEEEEEEEEEEEDEEEEVFCIGSASSGKYIGALRGGEPVCAAICASTRYAGNEGGSAFSRQVCKLSADTRKSFPFIDGFGMVTSDLTLSAFPWTLMRNSGSE